MPSSQAGTCFIQGLAYLLFRSWSTASAQCCAYMPLHISYTARGTGSHASNCTAQCYAYMLSLQRYLSVTGAGASGSSNTAAEAHAMHICWAHSRTCFVQRLAYLLLLLLQYRLSTGCRFRGLLKALLESQEVAVCRGDTSQCKHNIHNQRV